MSERPVLKLRTESDGTLAGTRIYVVGMDIDLLPLVREVVLTFRPGAEPRMVVKIDEAQLPILAARLGVPVENVVEMFRE